MARVFKQAAIALCVAGSASAAGAAPLIYTYTGATYSLVLGNYVASNRVTGSFTLDGPLAANFTGYVTPTAFGFNDGMQTISSANIGGGTSQFQFTTDATGAISSYKVMLKATTLSSITVENDSAKQGDLALNYFNGVSLGSVYVPGVFTPQVTAVPEPMTWTLMIVGFGATGMALRRRAVTRRAALT